MDLQTLAAYLAVTAALAFVARRMIVRRRGRCDGCAPPQQEPPRGIRSRHLRVLP